MKKRKYFQSISNNPFQYIFILFTSFAQNIRFIMVNMIKTFTQIFHSFQIFFKDTVKTTYKSNLNIFVYV